MNKSGRHNLTAILLSTMLFLTFAMVHEFDFLLPPSPVAATATSSIPVPDIAEEAGIEDEIEYDDSFVITFFSNEKSRNNLYPVNDLFIAGVLTPPPDQV